MNRLRVFALAGLGLLGLSFGSAQAAGWHRTHYAPACQPVVACPVPCPVVTAAPVVCPPVPCVPVKNYYPGFRLSYYGRFDGVRGVHYRHGCR